MNKNERKNKFYKNKMKEKKEQQYYSTPIYLHMFC